MSGVFPDTKNEAAESGHVWLSPSLHFRGAAREGRSGAEAGFVEQVGVRLKRQGDGAPPPRLHRGPGE